MASQGSQESPKHLSQGLEGQVLPWVETVTLIWSFPPKAKLSLLLGFMEAEQGTYTRATGRPKRPLVLQRGRERAVHHRHSEVGSAHAQEQSSSSACPT